MSLKNILGNIGCAALGTIAPPFGGMAAGYLKKALGLKAGATEMDIQQGLECATPEQIAAIKKAENQFQLELKKLGVDILKIDQADRNSARNMQATTKSLMPSILSTFVTLGFFGALFFMLTGELPAGEKDVLLVMLGSLGTAWTGIIAYWFGSSTGSKEKTDLLGKK